MWPQTVDLLTDEDDVPPVPVEPVSKLGDLYVLGDHRLLCGDSTVLADVERLMDGQKADMVFTDPPYGVDYDGGHAVKGVRREKLANDATPEIYTRVLPVAFWASKPSAALYLWFSDSKSAAVTAAVTAAGYEIRNTLIWNKNLAQFGAIGAQYKSKHEPCLYCFKKGQPPFWQGPNNEVSVWDVSRGQKNEFHPTQKPVELAERAFGNSCPDAGAVLDLFGGSGSTLIAAEKTGRRCYIMELSPAYCDVICQRWEQATGKKAVRDGANT
jgi:DNA modification methylase